MRTKLNNVRANSIQTLLIATFGLALTFTFSRSSGGDDNDCGAGNGGENGVYGTSVIYEGETYSPG
jgi:hypothetical protein